MSVDVDSYFFLHDLYGKWINLSRWFSTCVKDFHPGI